MNIPAETNLPANILAGVKADISLQRARLDLVRSLPDACFHSFALLFS